MSNDSHTYEEPGDKFFLPIEKPKEPGIETGQSANNDDNRNVGGYGDDYSTQSTSHANGYRNPETSHNDAYRNPHISQGGRYHTQPASQDNSYLVHLTSHNEVYRNSQTSSHTDVYRNQPASHNDGYSNAQASHANVYFNTPAFHDPYRSPHNSHDGFYRHPQTSHDDGYSNSPNSHVDSYFNDPQATHNDGYGTQPTYHDSPYRNTQTAHDGSYRTLQQQAQLVDGTPVSQHDGYGSTAAERGENQKQNIDQHSKIDNESTAKDPRIYCPYRPNISYPVLIAIALMMCETGKMRVKELYKTICELCPYYKDAKKNTWQNAIRHSLTNDDFLVDKTASNSDRGNYYRINQEKWDDMEAHKWENGEIDQSVEANENRFTAPLSSDSYANRRSINSNANGRNYSCDPSNISLFDENSSATSSTNDYDSSGSSLKISNLPSSNPSNNIKRPSILKRVHSSAPLSIRAIGSIDDPISDYDFSAPPAKRRPFCDDAESEFEYPEEEAFNVPGDRIEPDFATRDSVKSAEDDVTDEAITLLMALREAVDSCSRPAEIRSIDWIPHEDGNITNPFRHGIDIEKEDKFICESPSPRGAGDFERMEEFLDWKASQL